MQRHDAALASLDRAIGLKPDLADAHVNRGSVLFRLGRYGEALASRERVIVLKPDLPYAVGNWLYSMMSCSDWSDFDSACQRLLAGIDRGDRVATPYVSLLVHSSPEQQQRCARAYTADQYPARAASSSRREPNHRDRIRIGYVSAAFRNTPGAHLMSHLFECHDRSAFEIVALDVGPPSDDAWRRRLRLAFDSFHEVGSRSDREIAALVEELEIDILIHRDGHNDLTRTGIFALRPAPVQVNYLGYPGTLGASYIDYIIADRALVPEESRHHFDEKIVYLPHSYQPNDSTRIISDRPMSREEFGLADDAFVFCCFNNNSKITPDVFDVWMRLLRAVANSVLWLLECSTVAAENLRREAETRGVSPRRLIFTPRIEVSQHLARHRCADLCLDTFYYNAHTTASDALWAGLPVLTCPGEAMAARVAASLLAAVGLPEMIARDRDEYEAKALELARDPARLAAIRRRLAENRTTEPLFDTARYARHLEQAFLQMHERYRTGLPPDHIVIPA
jgi:predicted O-linked N-acetylglucosamine transferase (SPINDLY family)